MIPIAKPIIGKEEIEAAGKALESGMLTGGPLVEEFEKKLASYHGYKYAEQPAFTSPAHLSE
jgi:perosamine synthetase